MKIIITIMSVVISVTLIMLMIQVFNTTNQNDNIGLTYTPLISSNENLIYKNYTYTIDCRYMDMQNIIIYFNGLKVQQYYNADIGYIKYYYTYNCDDKLLLISTISEYDVYLGIDLKINHTLMDELT